MKKLYKIIFAFVLVLSASFFIQTFEILPFMALAIFLFIMGMATPQLFFVSSLFSQKKIYQPTLQSHLDMRNPLVLVNYFAYAILFFAISNFVLSIGLQFSILNLGFLLSFLFLGIQISIYFIVKQQAKVL